MRPKTRMVRNLRRRLWRGYDIVLTALPLDRSGLPQIMFRCVRFTRRNTTGGLRGREVTIRVLRQIRAYDNPLIPFGGPGSFPDIDSRKTAELWEDALLRGMSNCVGDGEEDDQ